MNRFLFVLALTAGLAGCEKLSPLEEDLGSNAEIIGTWVEVSFEEEVKTQQRSGARDPDLYGFVIQEDGGYVERKNAGWCGTPPISYANFEGSWTALSDSLLEVTVGYWGGIMNYQIRIVSVDEEHLEIRYLYAEAMTDSK